MGNCVGPLSTQTAINYTNSNLRLSDIKTLQQQANDTYNLLKNNLLNALLAEPTEFNEIRQLLTAEQRNTIESDKSEAIKDVANITSNLTAIKNAVDIATNAFLENEVLFKNIETKFTSNNYHILPCDDAKRTAGLNRLESESGSVLTSTTNLDTINYQLNNVVIPKLKIIENAKIKVQKALNTKQDIENKALAERARQAELARQEARIAAENARIAAENARIAAEKARIAAEKEAARIAAENARIAVERARQAAAAAAKAAQENKDREAQLEVEFRRRLVSSADINSKWVSSAPNGCRNIITTPSTDQTIQTILCNDNEYLSGYEKVTGHDAAPSDKNVTRDNIGQYLAYKYSCCTVPIGAIGSKGLTGLPGLDGVNGMIGDSGSKGPLGPEGPQGLKGPIGKKGESGKQGKPGIIGPPGPKGEPGKNIKVKEIQQVPGPMGPSGKLAMVQRESSEQTSKEDSILELLSLQNKIKNFLYR